MFALIISMGALCYTKHKMRLIPWVLSPGRTKYNEILIKMDLLGAQQLLNLPLLQFEVTLTKVAFQMIRGKKRLQAAVRISRHDWGILGDFFFKEKKWNFTELMLITALVMILFGSSRSTLFANVFHEM